MAHRCVRRDAPFLVAIGDNNGQWPILVPDCYDAINLSATLRTARSDLFYVVLFAKMTKDGNRRACE
jgi:hypothetical protein